MKLRSFRFLPILTFLFLIPSNHSLSAQSVLETNASLIDATIFSRGASLHHTAKQVSVPNGNSELVINQIAQNVDPHSIRITSGSNQITILSVSFERDYLVKGENQSSQYVSLKKEYDKAKETLDAMANARKGEEGALALLEENRKFGGQNVVSPTSIAGMIRFYRDEYKILSANIIDLKNKEADQQKIVAKLNKQMQEAGGSGQNAGQLVVRMNSSQSVKTDFNINYFTDNVSWTPFYEIRVDNLNEPVQLVYKANVSQNTGIDWKQIKMAFSSGNPTRNNNAPQFDPWWVGFQKQQQNSIDMMLRNKAAGIESMEAVVVTGYGVARVEE